MHFMVTISRRTFISKSTLCPCDLYYNIVLLLALVPWLTFFGTAVPATPGWNTRVVVEDSQWLCSNYKWHLSPRPRRGLRVIVFTLYVCVSVCPANILVFYLSAIRRDIDLKSKQDIYMVVLNSLNKWHS